MKKLLSIAIIIMAILFVSCASSTDTKSSPDEKEASRYQIRFDGIYRTEADINLDDAQISISLIYRFISDNVVICGVVPSVLIDMENIKDKYTIEESSKDRRLCTGSYTLSDNKIIVTEEDVDPYTLVIANEENEKSNDALILLREIVNEKTLLYRFEAFDTGEESEE